LRQVNNLCRVFVVGLEMDEYWNASTQLRMTRLALSLTTSDTIIAAHWTRNKWSGDGTSAWWNAAKSGYPSRRLVGALQYGIGESDSQFRSSTQTYVSRLNGVGVRGVYAEGANQRDPGRGQLAIGSGMVGTWQGI